MKIEIHKKWTVNNMKLQIIEIILKYYTIEY